MSHPYAATDRVGRDAWLITFAAVCFLRSAPHRRRSGVEPSIWKPPRDTGCSMPVPPRLDVSVGQEAVHGVGEDMT